MPRRVIGYVIGALGGVLSAPAVLIVGLFGMLVPAAIVFLGRRTMAVEVLAIGAFGGAGLGLVWIGVTDYFANWAGTQSMFIRGRLSEPPTVDQHRVRRYATRSVADMRRDPCTRGSDSRPSGGETPD
jgi:hypothetical protein